MVITDPGDCEGEEWRHDPPASSGHDLRVLRCPYHYWTYDLTGQLVAAPEMQRSVDFDRAAVALPRLAVEVWQGFIFANLDPTAAPLGPRLAHLDALVANWHIASMVGLPPRHLRDLPWNWKIMHENSVEPYHIDRLHSPLHDAVPSTGTLPGVDRPDPAAIVARVRARHPDFALNPTNRALFPSIPTLTAEERQLAAYALVPPTLLFGLNTDSVFYRLVLPKSVDRIDIVFGYLVPEEYRSRPGFEDLLELASSTHLRFNRQDFMANHGVQRGLRSSLARPGRYSWQEAPLADFNRWLIERYRRAAPAGVPVPATTGA
jgi:phenylpropionate dioxygenase-like ring-hydroxylating dioxygenase large terminal subunit